MRLRTFPSLLGAGLLMTSAAIAQDRAVQDCRGNVASALGLRAGNVDTAVSGNGQNGNPVVEWQANLSGRQVRGFCETDRSGRVISTQLGQFSGGFGGGGPRNGGGIFGGIGGGGGGVRGGGFGNNNGGNGGAIVSVDVDTSGRGTFSGMGQNVRITRSWVDTRDQPTVALSGEGNFKVNFYGVVTGSNQDREFTMRITGSDRGDANGTATVRLNSNRDEVEAIQVSGRLGRNAFNGSFNRD